mmetsp:Transcript_2940/g.3912  ORF Transcript_2940/g.3912 Transcript_2940/m.3912 type:complete len:109 (-) Transcript_2940:103-429(-)
MLATKRRKIQNNDNGGVYAVGVALTEEKWVEIQSTYQQIVDNEGSCSERRLATECKISRGSSNKEITSYNDGMVPFNYEVKKNKCTREVQLYDCSYSEETKSNVLSCV